MQRRPLYCRSHVARSDMARSHRTRSGVAWLELLLGLAAVGLLFQFFPSLFHKLAWAADMRNWSQLTWFVLNVAIVFVLVGVRFGPDLVDDWQGRRQRIAKEHTKAEKVKKLKEQRETLERVKTSRRRRIY